MLQRLCSIFFYFIVAVVLSSPYSLTIANPRTVLKKQSHQIGMQICQRGASYYYSDISKKQIKRHCNKIILAAKPSVHQCIDEINFLNMSHAKVNQCLINKLQKNKKFIHRLLSAVVTICLQETLKKHPNASKNEKKEFLDTCKKTAPIEIKHIVRKLLPEHKT